MIELENENIEKSNVEIFRKILYTYPYFEAGELEVVTHYDEGLRELQTTLFDKQNNTRINIFYEDGEELRRDIMVFDNLGRTIRITKYIDGSVPYGLWEYYDSDSRLIKTESFRG